jgi:hypothetical protein
LGEAPISFPEQFLVFPAHVLVATAQYYNGAYISKGNTNKNKKNKKKLPKKLLSFQQIFVKLWLF